MNAEEVTEWEVRVLSGTIHPARPYEFKHRRSSYVRRLCRCGVCRAAANAYARENYARRKEIILARRRELREGDKQWK